MYHTADIRSINSHSVSLGGEEQADVPMCILHIINNEGLHLIKNTILKIIYIHTCQVSGFWVESPDFAPCLTPCAVSPRGETKSPDFQSCAGFLRINMLFHLKVTQLCVLHQLWLGPSQLISKYLLKITTHDGFGNYNNQ